MKRNPSLYSLGMGGIDHPLPRLQAKFRWKTCLIPFYFRIVHPTMFFRRINFLRSTPARRIALDFLALSGLGWIGVKFFEAASKVKGGMAHRDVQWQRIGRFGKWADDLWEQCGKHYAFIGQRDSEILNILYPENSSRFHCLKIQSRGQLVGWAVVLDRKGVSTSYFGNMRLGSLADCIALPEDAADVVYAASRYLQERGVDIMVSNQSHSMWGTALKRAGFLEGPSNFGLSMSPGLVSRFAEPFDEIIRKMHLNRGDGDGPINL